MVDFELEQHSFCSPEDLPIAALCSHFALTTWICTLLSIEQYVRCVVLYGASSANTVARSLRHCLNQNCDVGLSALMSVFAERKSVEWVQTDANDPFPTSLWSVNRPSSRWSQQPADAAVVSSLASHTLLCRKMSRTRCPLSWHVRPAASGSDLARFVC